MMPDPFRVGSAWAAWTRVEGLANCRGERVVEEVFAQQRLLGARRRGGTAQQRMPRFKRAGWTRLGERGREDGAGWAKAVSGATGGTRR